MILDARVSTGCSSLNRQLFHSKITEALLYRCKSTILNACATYQNPSLSLLLFGSSTLSLETNIAILE